MIEINRQGCHRIVILTRKWAIKMPNFTDGWRLFLTGLLANMQERVFSKAQWPELCPVIFSIPGGWLNIMPRVREMTDKEFRIFDVKDFLEKSDYVVPAEAKSNSFGWLNGHVVAIDYGS